MIYLNPMELRKDTFKEKEPTKKEYTVKELKQMCKDKGIVGYSKMKEDELIKALGL